MLSVPTPYRIGIALASLIIVALGFFQVFLPRFDEIRSRLEERSRRELEIARRERELAALRNLASQFRSLPPEASSRLVLALPSEPELATWLSSLAAIAERSGVLLDALEKGHEVAADGGVRVEYLARVRGTYPSLRLFFALAEQNLRLTDVREMRFENTNPTSPDPLLSANMTLAIYYQP